MLLGESEPEDSELRQKDYAILEMAVKDKDGSLAVQRYLDSIADQRELDTVGAVLQSHLESLLTNKFGSYVVQHLIEIHPSSKKRVGRLLMAKSSIFLNNEFSSRVIQRLFSLDREFSESFFTTLCPRLSTIINSFSGSILLSKLVCSIGREEHFDSIIDFLEGSKKVLVFPLVTRVLYAVAEHCPETCLDRLAVLIKSKVWGLMNDKFGNLLLQSFFKRKQRTGMDLITQVCIKHSTNIFVRKYPKLMLMNLVLAGSAGELASKMVLPVERIPKKQLQTVAQKKESFALLLLLLCTGCSLETLSYSVSKISLSLSSLASLPRLDKELRIILRTIQNCGQCR